MLQMEHHLLLMQMVQLPMTLQVSFLTTQDAKQHASQVRFLTTLDAKQHMYVRNYVSALVY